MSDPLGITEKENNFLNYLNRFHLGLSMVKICAQSCDILSKQNRIANNLKDSETQCLQLCGQNIKMTYTDFHQNVVNAKIFGEIEAEDDEDE